MPVMSSSVAIDRRAQVIDFVKAIMIEGNDYGKVPGTTKNTLLKPGAEKLTTFFGLTPSFCLVESVQDWTGQDHGGEPFFYYWYTCQLRRSETLIAEADGSCNSWETKYRYRNAKRVCPQCGQETIIKGKEQYGGGWLCFAKLGGCGAKWQDGDTEIEGQALGRVNNPNPADQVNTIKKMAQKRSLVAATLLAVNASEFFTQDLEDLPAVESRTPPPTPPPAPKKPAQKKPTKQPKPTPKPEKAWPDRPFDAAHTIRGLRMKRDELAADHPADTVPEGRHGALMGALAAVTAGDKERHALGEAVWGKPSTKDWTAAEAEAIVGWVNIRQDDEGDWMPNAYAVEEARAVTEAARSKQP